MEENINIPKERIAVLVGKNGEIKRKIEKQSNSKISVNSKTGEISLETDDENTIGFYNALDIIKAIARGFSPEHAFLLLEEDFLLDIINVADIIDSSSQKAIEQKKGRVIGKDGKMRKEIEQKTNCFVSVYGKTISIIGKVEEIETARKAIEMLLRGTSHSAVYGFLNRQQFEGKKFEL